MANRIGFIETSEKTYSQLNNKEQGTFYKTEENVYLGSQQLNNSNKEASGSEAGLMSASDKKKLDGMKNISVSVSNGTLIIKTT